MKKNLATLAAMFVLASATAIADDGVAGGTANLGRTAAEACGNAKTNAANHIPRNTHVVGHTECQCSQDELTRLWSCSVDAKWKTNGG
jgi:hypothetical protein